MMQVNTTTAAEKLDRVFVEGVGREYWDEARSAAVAAP
jgi:hypothetical protein